MNIMFICAGNICRSAMADWLLKKKLKDLGRDDIKVFSCGVCAEEADVSTWEAKKVMKDEYDVDLSNHIATHIRKSKINEMDLILCATNSHKIAVLDMYPNLKEKVYTMKEYVGYNRQYHDKIDIKDPWGYDIETYRSCASEIDECIELLLKKLKIK